MAWKPDYVDVDELKHFARITAALSTEDEAELQLVVTSASRAVDKATHRQFGQVDDPEVRRYRPRWSFARGLWKVRIDDVMDAAGLEVELGGEPLTEFDLEPLNAAEEGKPFEELLIRPDSPVQPSRRRDVLTATALWGWDEVPPTVKQATLLQANRFKQRQTSPFGVAGSPEAGSEIRLLDRVDPDVSLMLREYIRDPVVFA